MEEKRRDERVTPADVLSNKLFKVHVGKGFKEIKVTINHIGKKYGEFAVTKVPAIWKKHGKKH